MNEKTWAQFHHSVARNCFAWIHLLVCDVRMTIPKPLLGAVKAGQLALSGMCLYKALCLKPDLMCCKRNQASSLRTLTPKVSHNGGACWVGSSESFFERRDWTLAP